MPSRNFARPVNEDIRIWHHYKLSFVERGYPKSYHDVATKTDSIASTFQHSSAEEQKVLSLIHLDFWLIDK